MSTYKEIVDAVMHDRWPDGKRGFIQRQVRLRHAYVFSCHDWPFRRQGPLDVIVPAGASVDLEIPGLRAATIRSVTDSDGDDLQGIDRRRFEQEFTGDTNEGTPWAYSVYDEGATGKRLYLGPSNDAERTLKVSFTLRLCHFDSNGVLVDGNLTSDDDRPIWPEEFDDLLILGAAATAMKFEADPSWRPLEDDFQRFLLTMQGDVVDEAGGFNPQFARDPL